MIKYSLFLKRKSMNIIVKDFVITVVALCFYNAVMAQDGNHVFLKEGKIWNCMLVQTGPDFCTEYFKNVIHGDSIVDGTTYFKMYRETDTVSELDFYALWREEGGKVFAYVPQEGNERLMYDFSAQPNSVITCEGENIRVKATTVVTKSSQNFKCLSIFVSDDYHITWVSGIGSPFGPGYPLGPMFTDGKKTELLSCYEDDMLIFESEDFDKAIYTGLPCVISPKYYTSYLYDLNGHTVQGTPKKGVYIQNGRKVIAK